MGKFYILEAKPRFSKTKNNNNILTKCAGTLDNFNLTLDEMLKTTHSFSEVNYLMIKPKCIWLYFYFCCNQMNE